MQGAIGKLGSMERGPLGYLWLVLKTAWRHSFHAAHSLLLALIIGVGLVTWLAPQVEVMVDLHGWQVATVVLSSIIAVRLLLAPYWIWKEDGANIAKQKNEMEQLKSQIDSEAAKQLVIDDLSQELSWAIDNLLNRNQGKEWTEEMVAPFEQDMNAWCDKISNKLENRRFFTQSDQVHFDKLGFIQPIGMSSLGRLNWLLSMLNTKFDRLRDIIHRPGSGRP
jgi:hypothetical protein